MTTPRAEYQIPTITTAVLRQIEKCVNWNMLGFSVSQPLLYNLIFKLMRPKKIVLN